MKQSQKTSDDLAYFISFCIEIYKKSNGMNGAETAKLFADTGLIGFLAENFESIHTQSPQWILEEIKEYISTCKKNNR